MSFDFALHRRSCREPSCRLCWLAATDVRYQRLWGLPSGPAVRPTVGPPRCRHLGAPTGATVRCPSCKGHIEVKVLACAVFGTCTLAKRVGGVPGCCAGCGCYSAFVEG